MSRPRGDAWEPEEIATLRACVLAGMTAAQAGAKLNRSKPSCLGKANRCGFPFSAPDLAAFDGANPNPDALHLRQVVKANVYGFGRTILVDVGALA